MTMTRINLVAAILLNCLLCWPLFGAEPVPLADPGFEQEYKFWQGEQEMSKILPEAARSGNFGLRVTDNSDVSGSNLRMKGTAVKPKQTYMLKFWSRSRDHNAVGVYLIFVNAEGKSLNTMHLRNEISMRIPSSPEWRQYTLAAEAPADASTVDVWVHSFNANTGSADIDDFTLWELNQEEAKKMAAEKISATRSFPASDPERIAAISQMLSEKPRGFGPPASDREAWNKLAQQARTKVLLAEAERYAAMPPPDLPDELYLEFTQNGNRTRYQSPYGLRTRRIFSLAKAECLQAEGNFLPALEAELRALCADRSWVMPAHDAQLTNFHGTSLYGDLGATDRAFLAATVGWWLGDRLPADLLADMHENIRRRVLTPYQEACRTGQIKNGLWWMTTHSNWNAVCTANMVGIALTICDSREERAEALAAMEISNPRFLSGFTPDGYCSEGIAYWNYGFGHYLYMAEMVREATSGEINLLDAPVIEAACAYASNIMIDTTSAPAFADCGVNATPSWPTKLIIAKRLPHIMPEQPAPNNTVSLGLQAFVVLAMTETEAEAAEAPKAAAMPARSYFSDAGVLICRSRHDTDTFGAAIKGGHNNEMHNHNDVGSYLAVINDHAYLVDPGGEQYTRRTFSKDRYVSKMLNSYGHPVPVVAGQLQRQGRQFCGTFVETDFNDERDLAVIDFKAAYEVPELTDLRRSFTFRRDRPEIVIKDEVTFSSPQTFATALVTLDKSFIRSREQVVVYDGQGACQVSIEVSGSEWTLAPEVIENPGMRNVPTRIGINLTSPVTTATVTMTIVPAALSDDLPGFYREPDVSKLVFDFAGAIMVQAEDFADEDAGEVVKEPKIGADGLGIKLWDKVGHTLSWDFAVPEAGKYALQLRLCHVFGDGVARQMLLDGKLLHQPEAPFYFPGTGGWSNNADQWQNVWVASNRKVLQLDLTPGTHRLTMINHDQRGLNLDWLKLVPVK